MLFYVRDRTNFPPKKSSDVVPKQSLVASAIAKKTCSSVSQGLKETIQNGPVEKSSSRAVVSAAVAKNDVPSVLSKEILSKEASVAKSSRFSSECLALKNGPMSESSPNVALSKQRVKGPPVLSPSLEISMPPSTSSVKGSGIANLDNTVAASTRAKFNEFSEDKISKKDQGILDLIQANCIGSQNSAADKPDSEKTSLKVIGNSISFAVYICYGGFCTLFTSP